MLTLRIFFNPNRHFKKTQNPVSVGKKNPSYKSGLISVLNYAISCPYVKSLLFSISFTIHKFIAIYAGF